MSSLLKTPVMFIFLSLMISCSNIRLSEEKFNKVEYGMTISEVKFILGEPDVVTKVAGAFASFGYIREKSLMTHSYSYITFGLDKKVSFMIYESPQ